MKKRVKKRRASKKHLPKNKDNIFNYGDVKFVPWGGELYELKSLKDFQELHKKIEIRIKHYGLVPLLLKNKEFLLKTKDTNDFNIDFAFAMLVKYALLNCGIYYGWKEIYDKEFEALFNLVMNYTIYDPKFFNEEKTKGTTEAVASLLLRKIGSQSRYSVRKRNTVGRTLILYDEMVKNGEAPEFIEDLVNFRFEEDFGVPLLDFIRIGFLMWAQAGNNKGGMDRGYFDKAREKGITLPEDDMVKRCIDLVAYNPSKFKNLCAAEGYDEGDLRAYKFNPLFSFPIIRPWGECDEEEPEEDRFIAPIPDLVLYRFTTGLYYRLFNLYNLEFSQYFGELFGRYVGKILDWCGLPGIILNEEEIAKQLPKYKGKRPDFVVFCKEGIVLIECKATKYSQDMYEKGLDANEKGCLNQIKKSIKQMNEFESEIPSLCKNIGASYTDLKVQKIMVSFEDLQGLQKGPKISQLRTYVNDELKREGITSDLSVLWVWFLEESQPYMYRGYNFWSFLLSLSKDQKQAMDELYSSSDVEYKKDSKIAEVEEKFFEQWLPPDLITKADLLHFQR